MRAYSMFIHLTPETPSARFLNTIKVDALGVQNGTAVNRESDTLDLGGTLFGLGLVFDSDLGFLRFEERVVDLAFVVLSLSHQLTFQPDIMETYTGLDNIEIKGLD
jgi:hypothetical protein